MYFYDKTRVLQEKYLKKKPIADLKKIFCNWLYFSVKFNWTQKMINDILNIPYRHILFTIPEEYCEKWKLQ